MWIIYQNEIRAEEGTNMKKILLILFIVNCNPIHIDSQDDQIPIISDSDHHLPPQTNQQYYGPQNIAGSRLQISYQVHTGDDGMQTQYQFGYWDQKLSIYCSVTMLSSDGNYRCLPEDMLSISGYIDYKCTKPIVVMTKGVYECKSNLPTYAVSSVENSCPTKVIVYRLGNPEYKNITGLFLKNNTSCTFNGFSSPTDLYVFEATEIPIDTFVTIKKSRIFQQK